MTTPNDAAVDVFAVLNKFLTPHERADLREAIAAIRELVGAARKVDVSRGEGGFLIPQMNDLDALRAALRRFATGGES